MRPRALDDDDMFKAKAPLARVNAGGMPASVKKVRPPMARRDLGVSADCCSTEQCFARESVELSG